MTQTDCWLMAYIAWEIEADCCRLTTNAHGAQHRGDFTKDDLGALTDTITQLDPQAQAIIVFSAGPPCPDYSRITEGPGREGTEGIKFEIYAKWLKEAQHRLKPRKAAKLVENVIPHRRGDIQYFEEKLQCTAVILDASEFKRISRPRTWWTSINWDDASVSTVFGTAVSWKKYFGTQRLHCPQPVSEVFIPDGWKAPMCWAEGETLPCLTTPAPTEAGRAAPRSQKGKMDSATHSRWVADNRQYAPWHYVENSLMEAPTGKLQTPPIETKESLHHIPVGYTASLPEKARHKAVANSWHVGVASLLMWLLLLQTKAATAVVIDRPRQPCELPALDTLAQWWKHSPPLGPGSHVLSASHRLESTQDMWQHWNTALTLSDPAQETLQLEPHLECTLQLQAKANSDLSNLRQRVCHEVRQIVSDLREDTETWLRSLRPHIRNLYGTIETCIQVLALRTIAELFHWGDMHLFQEMEQGFPLLGQLAPGWGWPRRNDERYQHPLERSQLLTSNLEYIQQKLRKHRCDPHWETLLAEITQDVVIRRMDGPFSSPKEWQRRTVAAPQFKHTKELKQGPTEHHPTSMAFSILQTGADGKEKIRRGEDWRRGLQNMTVQAQDAPVNHRPITFVAIARAMAQRGMLAHVWGTDQEDAYRQLPVANPEDTWVVLFTPNGATLWRHNALLFGATGSVWAYGRTADFIMWPARTLLLTPCIHYVDDFAAVENTQLSESSFEASHCLWEMLGFRFKPSKKQPPATQHKIQGVIMTIAADQFILEPDEARSQRVITQLKEIKLQNDVHPDEAMRLAGKLQFMTETMAGQAMRACLKPLYHRAYQGPQSGPLGVGLQDAIDTMIHILENLQPRIIRFQPRVPAVLYADAFFQAGDRRIKISDADTADWDPDITNLMHNGWGFVVHTHQGTYFAHGEIPGQLLGRFTERRAFIYALEIIAQMIALISTRHLWEHSIWCWIDNEPGKTALKKGCGRDRKVNRLLAALWSFITKEKMDPHWRRVCSSANISDGISRGDLTMAHQMGWRRIECDWQKIYDELSRCTSSLQQALRSHQELCRAAECDSMACTSRTTMAYGQRTQSCTNRATTGSTTSKTSAMQCLLHETVWEGRTEMFVNICMYVSVYACRFVV